MYYFVITLSAMLFSLQFVFAKGFQKETGSGFIPSMKTIFYSSIVGLIAALAMNKFIIEFSWFSLILSLMYSATFIACSVSSLRAYEYAPVSLASVFSMIGSMILPFIYGIICGDELTTGKILCCVLVIISILLTIDKSTSLKKAFPFLMAVFIFNGSLGIIMKFHQSSEMAVDSQSFLAISKIIMILFSMFFLIKVKDFKLTKKALAFSTGYALLNTVASFLLLVAMFYLPVSVQYPFLTGGTIVFSVIFDLIRGIKLKKRNIISAGIALIASVIIMF